MNMNNLCQSGGNTPENRSAIDREIAQLEADWQSQLTTMPSQALMWAAQLLASGEDPGLDAVQMQSAASVLLLREVRRRWEDELRWSEAADELRENADAGSQSTVDV